MSGLVSLVAGDPFTGTGHMLSQPFELRAYIAGTCIALAAGLVGHFVVLRNQVFTGDALSHVAFTGALAALAAGVDLRIGLFAGCVVFGMAMAGLGRQARPDDVVIGSVFAWVLGLGVFFLTVYTTGSAGAGGRAGINVLFGSIYGLSGAETGMAAAVGAGTVVVLVAVARPLLFASIDPSVARAQGVPVAALGVGFLALVGVTAGEATQAVGALLLLGLLATPAGAAQKLTADPYRAMWVSAGLAILSVWAGLGWSYAAPSVPPSFGILSVSTLLYVLAVGLSRVRTGLSHRSRYATSSSGWRGAGRKSSPV